VLLADDAALRDVEEALEITERASEDFALGFARWALGIALVHRSPLRSVSADWRCWGRSATCA
jgi:hypothetical protein